MNTLCPLCDAGAGPCYHEYEKMLTEAPGTALFTYDPAIGWQVFSWYPSKAEITTNKCVQVLDAKGKPRLLMLTGIFIKKPIVKRLCKQPGKLIYSFTTGRQLCTHTPRGRKVMA